MQQVKVFKSVESDVRGLEDEINRWIRQSGAHVVSITGNIAPQTAGAGGPGLTQGGYPPSDVVVIVLYESGS